MYCCIKVMNINEVKKCIDALLKQLFTCLSDIIKLPANVWHWTEKDDIWFFTK